MCTIAVPRAGELDAIVERITPYAIRGETREKLHELKEDYERRLANLNGLLATGRLGCPICESAEHVIITGSGRGGAKKFECRAEHDPAVTKRQGTSFNFSTYTSHEAMQVYRDFLGEALALLALCGGTYDGISQYLDISRHMVEFSVEVLLDYLDQEDKGEPIVVGDDIVVVYADFSSTRVSRSASVIMSRVGDAVAYQVVCNMNTLTAWNFVKALKARLVARTDATVVFVTDGERAWVDPIRSIFPGAVHVRQFHCDSARGIVYVHFPYEGKLYTMRCLWDAVLEQGVAGGNALRMRRRRKLLRAKSTERKDDRTELYHGVILWEGVVYEPRGVRRKKPERRKGATVAGATEERDATRTAKDVHGDTPAKPDGAGDGGSGTVPNGRPEGRGRSEHIAPATDGARRIFEGTLGEALDLPAVRHAYSILVSVFGGLHITSNEAECLFSVKPALRCHRTVKSGDALVHVLLYLWTRVRKRPRDEIRAFFRGVVSCERLRRVAIRGRRPTDGNGAMKRELVLDACTKGNPIVIQYCDAMKRWTTRMIEPLELETDPYTGMIKVRAFCYLRNDERTFLLDRIINAIPVDTKLAVVG